MSIVLLASLGLVCALCIAGVLYQEMGSARDARRFPAPGQFVNTGGHRLHAFLSGASGPTVVFESGIAASSLSWETVRREVARFARVCTYDRAGLGWSDAADSPRSLDNVLGDFRALLKSLAIDGPLVVVGHSFGGLAALQFACRYPSELSGLVLVDPLPASEWCPAQPADLARLQRGVKLARRGARLARLGVVRLSLDLLRAGSRWIPKLAASLSARGGGSQLTERLIGEIRKLPPELWPVIQSHWCQPKSFHSMASHLEWLPVSAAGCAAECDLGHLPVVVLSASGSEAHARMAGASAAGEMWVAEKSGHWIQLDQPELVVAAIRRVLQPGLRD